MIASEDDGPRRLDILDVLDALASHYGETIREILGGWSWKLFCARWRRLVEYMDTERERRRDREREAAFNRLQSQTAGAHAQRMESGYIG